MIHRKSHEEAREYAVGLNVWELSLNVLEQVRTLVAETLNKVFGEVDDFGKIIYEALAIVSLCHQAVVAPEDLLLILQEEEEKGNDEVCSLRVA